MEEAPQLEQDVDKLSRTYNRYDTLSTTMQDAEEAFRKIEAHIQNKYPFIQFDPIDHPARQQYGFSRDSEGNYRVPGEYRKRGLFGISFLNLITLTWKSNPYCSKQVQEFMPTVKFEDSWLDTGEYFFDTFKYLDELLDEHIKNPIIY